MPFTVTYLRQRPDRHSVQKLLVRSKAQLQVTDTVMRKLGFVREGTQLPLLNETCVKCGSNVLAVRLPDEGWCRPCIRRTFGGEL